MLRTDVTMIDEKIRCFFCVLFKTKTNELGLIDRIIERIKPRIIHLSFKSFIQNFNDMFIKVHCKHASGTKMERKARKISIAPDKSRGQSVVTS